MDIQESLVFMSDTVALDRRLRFEIAGELWQSCGEFIGPDRVLELADRIYDQLNGEGDGLQIVKQELVKTGVPAHKLDHVTTLILMVLNDRVNAALAALRTASI
jgi:hypothetical protein